MKISSRKSAFFLVLMMVVSVVGVGGGAGAVSSIEEDTGESGISVENGAIDMSVQEMNRSSEDAEYVIAYITPSQGVSMTAAIERYGITRPRYYLGESFSAKVTKEKFRELKETRGIDVSRVGYARIPQPRQDRWVGNLGSASTKRKTPEDQTPYGIETVYKNTSIEKTSGGYGVDVAVLDTGVNVSHPDLKNSVEECLNFIGGNASQGCNDSSGHGTHVAGTVVADGGEDGEGIYGVAPGADLYAYKVCTNSLYCPYDAISAAIRKAADKDVEIISMSLGGKYNRFLDDAVAYAHSKGSLLVAASGNNPKKTKLDRMIYPAAHKEVVGVGAVNKTTDGKIKPKNYRVGYFSERGKNATSFKQDERYLEVSAPGGRVLSTSKSGGYEYRTGTSQATPHVSGIAAIVWNTIKDDENDGKADDVREYIRKRASKFDVVKGKYTWEGYDPSAGIGVPTVGDVEITRLPQPKIVYSPENPVEGEKVEFNASKSVDPDGEIEGYEWDFDNDGEFEKKGKTVSHVFEKEGEKEVALKVTDNQSATNKTKIRVAVANQPLREIWNSSFVGGDKETGYDIASAGNGYVVAGMKESGGNSQGYLTKIDSKGKEISSKSWGSDAELRSVVRVRDGFVSAGTTGGDAWIVKLDSSGNVAWNKTFGESGRDEWFNSVVSVRDGIVAAGGINEDSGDSWLVKLNGSGKEVWNKTYGGAEYDEVNQVMNEKDGNLSFVGTTDSFTDSRDFWIGGVSEDGEMLWNTTYGTPENDSGMSIVGTGAEKDGYVVAGYTESGTRNAVVAKLGRNGKIWEKTYTRSDDDAFYSVTETSSGYAVAGTTNSTSKSPSGWLVKINANGEDVAANTYGGPGKDGFNALVSRTSGFVAAGYTDSFSAIRSTYVVKAERLLKSIPEAIAGTDRKISFRELQNAIQYWATNQKVPKTGKKMKFKDLQELIRIWISDEKV